MIHFEQCIHHAFHAHKARTFDQNGVRAALNVRAHHIGHRRHIIKMLRTNAKRLRRLTHHLACCQQHIHAALRRMRTNLRVKGIAIITDFTHIAEYQNFAPRCIGQHVNRCQHRIGIRVIGVVNQNHALTQSRQTVRLQTTFGRYEIRQSIGDRVQRHTHRGGGGTRGQSVVNIVHARNIDLRGALPHRRDQLHGRGVQAQFVARAIRRVRRRIQAEFMRRNATRLCALDGLQRTIYVSGFAKILAPSWRVGYLAAPAELCERLLDTKLLSTLTTPSVLEQAMALCSALGAVYGLDGLPQTAAPAIDWGDGVLYDRARIWAEQRELVDAGLLRPELALAWYFDLPHETEAELAEIRRRFMGDAGRAQ